MTHETRASMPEGERLAHQIIGRLVDRVCAEADRRRRVVMTPSDAAEQVLAGATMPEARRSSEPTTVRPSDLARPVPPVVTTPAETTR